LTTRLHEAAETSEVTVRSADTESNGIPRPRIAVDTNCVIEWSEYRTGRCFVECSDHCEVVHRGLERLLSLAEGGAISLGVSNRFLADKIQDMEPARKQRHMHDFAILIARGACRIQSTLAFDIGWGRFATEDDRDLRGELARILHPRGVDPQQDGRWRNKQVDIDHLRDALQAGYSVFVTSDRGILRARKRLCDCGIQVMTMEEAMRCGF